MNVMKWLPAAGLCVCCTLSTSGCSSMMTHTGASQGYYPGTRASASMLVDSETSMALRPLALIDLPFSAVLDTLLLPWDYYHADENKAPTSPRERVRQIEQTSGLPPTATPPRQTTTQR